MEPIADRLRAPFTFVANRLNAGWQRLKRTAAFVAFWDWFRYRRQTLSALTRPIWNRLPRSAFAYVMISPFFILFGVFLAFPVVYTLYLSFFEYQGVSDDTLFFISFGGIEINVPQLAELEFVGFDHYARLLSGISYDTSTLFGVIPYVYPTAENFFWIAMFNTTYIFVFQVPLMIGFALLLAVLLNSALIRFKGIFRTLIAIPVSANIVAYSTIFFMIFNETGFLNTMLATVGIEGPAYLREEFWARWTIIGAVTWRWTGYNMIILLAGLQNIPQHLYEAAEIDGASRFEKFRYITLPQLRPVLLFVFVLSTIGTFKLFAEPFVITDGGPARSTTTIVQYIYIMAFERFELGLASAATYIFIVIVSALSIIQVRYGGDS